MAVLYEQGTPYHAVQAFWMMTLTPLDFFYLYRSALHGSSLTIDMLFFYI